MRDNPYSDGKIRGHADAIVRAIVVGLAIVVAWNAPCAWYWRVAIFAGIMFVLGIVYPAIQFALVKQRHRRAIDAEAGDADYQAMVRQLYPDMAADAEATKDFRAKMAAISEAHKNKTN